MNAGYESGMWTMVYDEGVHLSLLSPAWEDGMPVGSVAGSDHQHHNQVQDRDRFGGLPASGASASGFAGAGSTA